ncbi:Acetylornithine aminotransferase [hydrothermal vent metagenome]|uniref:Acetylornithine aminotransferase n=1 Tax=hydrothermal vent metagenome TaxID=652676 RepID=A0A3B0ZVN9_9ZZZZ
MADHLMNTYGRLPVTFQKGEGALLYDDKGTAYLDALAGIAVCGLGHSHPQITKAICDQASKLMHTTNIYGIEQQSKLADALCDKSGMDKVFFSNSGAEANEAAIKIARLYGNSKNIKNPTIIVMETSFHGRTLATLTATGNRKIQAGFEPLVQGFVRAPYNDLEAIKSIAENNKNVVAVLVEPIQGEGGINIPDAEYLTGIRSICDDNNWLMMLDEIQTGMCRTGKWFAFQHSNGSANPDIMTLAKALGNGIPIGACLANGKAADVLQPGNHGSTFGGNPLACRVANEVVSVLATEKLDQRAAQLGESMFAKFTENLSNLDGVTEIRSAGMMFAIQLNQPCTELVKTALEQNLLINVTAESVIRLLPPLIITDEQADTIVERITKIVTQFLAQS